MSEASESLAVARGPNGEDVCLIPTLVQDSPLRTVEGKFAYGANLDGTTDGHATSKTCKHTKFMRNRLDETDGEIHLYLPDDVSEEDALEALSDTHMFRYYTLRYGKVEFL